MKILIATTNGAKSHGDVLEYLKANRSLRGSKISLLAVIEPSNVVDATLSACGETRFRHLLNDRIADAQADLNKLSMEIRHLLPMNEQIETDTVVGDTAEATIKAANKVRPDLMLISANGEKHMKNGAVTKLISQSPCSVTFVKAAS